MKPRIRIPLWLAIVVPLGAYAIRAQFIRGGDWRPDLPEDAIVFGLLVMVVIVVGVMRRHVAQLDAEEASDAPQVGNGEIDEDGRRW